MSCRFLQMVALNIDCTTYGICSNVLQCTQPALHFCTQAIEDRHLQAALTQEDDSGSSSSNADSDDDSSDAELDAAVGADLDQHVDDAIVRAANQQHMNSSLLSMYSSPTVPMPSAPTASNLVSQNMVSAPEAAGNGQPAFAPPQVVEAAARRALAAEKAQQQALQAAKRGNGFPVTDDNLPSTSGQLNARSLSVKACDIRTHSYSQHLNARLRLCVVSIVRQPIQ